MKEFTEMLLPKKLSIKSYKSQKTLENDVSTEDAIKDCQLQLKELEKKSGP